VTRKAELVTRFLGDANIAALKVEMLRMGGQDWAVTFAAKLLPRMIKTLSSLHRKGL
jgi:hypothetical protein